MIKLSQELYPFWRFYFQAINAKFLEEVNGLDTQLLFDPANTDWGPRYVPGTARYQKDGGTARMQLSCWVVSNRQWCSSTSYSVWRHFSFLMTESVRSQRCCWAISARSDSPHHKGLLAHVPVSAKAENCSRWMGAHSSSEHRKVSKDVVWMPSSTPEEDISPYHWGDRPKFL